MNDMRYVNQGKPLDMHKNDKVLRYTAKKMQDISPYNPGNMRQKLKLLNDFLEDGYELKVLSNKQLKKQ
jgi:hypothetical protein